MAKQVILMSAGWSLMKGEYGERSGTKVYFDAGARPSATTVDEPLVGDAWDDGDNKDVFLQSITQSPIGEDTSAGFMYVCSFSTNYGSADILDIDRTDKQVSVTVSTGGEFDSYTHDPDSGEGGSLYESINLTDWTKITDSMTIARMNPTTNVTISERYIGKVSDLIGENALYTGKLNDEEMWGLGRGMILCTGVTAVPIKVLFGGARIIKWNRQYNYSIRHLSNPEGAVVENAWQMVFHKGKYVMLSNSDSSDGIDAVAPYLYATLPNPLPKSQEPL